MRDDVNRYIECLGCARRPVCEGPPPSLRVADLTECFEPEEEPASTIPVEEEEVAHTLR